MNIGIITIMDYTNYGNRLQNYALYHLLSRKFGCKTVTLASYELKPFDDGNYIVWFKNQILKKLCIFPHFVEKKFDSNVTRWANFEKWSKKIPTKKYYNCKQLPQNINNNYDYFFVGSDQVWNYHFSSSRFNDFFLKFANKEKRVSISASFGVDEIPKEWEQIYIDGLKNFTCISVREDAGQAIVKKLIGMDVPVLIDPVMMLSKEEWLKVSKKPRIDCSKPYILKYYLGNELEKDKIDTWAKNNGYEVYELLNDKIPELHSAGPGEFISLINNAEMICSDSFHCIVFSIIFSKPFIVYERQGKENYMTSRLNTLLKKFNLQDRWRHSLTEEQYLICDYGPVKDLLRMEQKKFADYIDGILK